MNAVEYLKAKQRMCNALARNSNYLIGKRVNGKSLLCWTFEKDFPEKAVEIVERWAKEHPIKTYLSVLLEKLPDVELDDMGLPTSCLFQLFNVDYRDCPLNYGKCYECWNREYKEEI